MRLIRLKQENCIECQKMGTLAKNLCQACYSKQRRNTPEGKKSLKLYNDTKGKIATQKYLSKQPPKEPKPPKEIKLCECGKLSIAKGLCRNCYQSKIVLKKYSYKPKEKKVINYIEIYNKVLSQVIKGNTISKSCRIVGICRGLFYDKITPIQKKEINSYKQAVKVVEIDNFYEDLY